MTIYTQKKSIQKEHKGLFILTFVWFVRLGDILTGFK